MVEKTKETDIKTVKGRRIRRHYFNCVALLIYAIPLFIGSIQPIFWKAIPVFSIICLILFLLLCVLIARDTFFGKILCVLSEKEIYFNQSMLTERVGSKKKKETICSVKMKYEDIRAMRYFPPEPRFRTSKIQSQDPKKVIIQGIDFELTVLYGSKSMVRQIERRKKELGICHGFQGIADIKNLEHYRDGFWKEVWDSFQIHKATDIFNQDFEIVEFYNAEEDNNIYITVRKGAYRFTFDINEDRLLMMAEHNSHDAEIRLSEISSISELYKHMQNFIGTYSD